jgi:cytochrome c oxidase assembly factor CtaG
VFALNAATGELKWSYVLKPRLAAFVAWHSPGLYRAAIRHPALNELEHLTLALSAICFWRMALQLAAGPRRGAWRREQQLR